ncbi:MAG: hypothetical protein M1434_15590 [Chloroflexi bacterium]|nr:hypothetical protein [Chloroflexota bacterium]MCL5276142.1 hypothetical protein [Chloroflexota bacterium]
MSSNYWRTEELAAQLAALEQQLSVALAACQSQLDDLRATPPPWPSPVVTGEGLGGGRDPAILTTDTPAIIRVQHTFNNEVTAQAPFLLGANASGQLVGGLNADKLDGQDGSYYLDYNNLTNTPSGGTIDTCKATLSGTSALAHNVDTAVALNAEAWDYNAMHSTSTNNSRVVIRTAGVYRITVSMHLAAQPASWTSLLKVRLNGATIIGTWYMGADVYGFYTLEYACSANDYVELVGRISNNNNPLNVDAAELSVSRVA